MPNLFSSIRDKFNNFSNNLRSEINTFSNIKDRFQRGINSFGNSKFMKFLESNDFGNIIRSGAEYLANKDIISHKAEYTSMNIADLLKELQHGNYGNALNYGTSILKSDYAQGYHFRMKVKGYFYMRSDPFFEKIFTRTAILEKELTPEVSLWTQKTPL